MRRLAEIAHKHGIPITWAMPANFARPFASDLTKWHESHGDEPLLMLDIAPIWETDKDLNDPRQSAEHIVTMREKLLDYVAAEWNKVQNAMEWALPNIASSELKNSVFVYALEKVGFKGMWGYRWESGEDKGCPFGFFYPSEDKHNFTGKSTLPIIAIPCTSINPTQVISKEATNPNDLLQILDGATQRTFDHYLANLKWNRWLTYIQHIPVENLTELTPEDLERLDAYFAHVCKQEKAQVVKLSDAVHDYKLICNETPSTFLLIEADTEKRSKLFYYDAECQLIFEPKQMEPIDMRNYVSPPIDSRHGVEFNLPQIETFRPTRARNQLRMHFTLESTKAMPYGFAIWGNHEGLSLAKSNACTVTWLDDRLLFIRVDLQAGKNEVEVVLTI